jgi:hypothetical protein
LLELTLITLKGLAYIPVLNYAQIVKLYLPKEIRDEFYDCARRYSIIHTSLDLGDQRQNSMKKYSDRIQQIFEDELDELSAYFWIKSGVNQRCWLIMPLTIF